MPLLTLIFFSFFTQDEFSTEATWHTAPEAVVAHFRDVAEAELGIPKERFLDAFGHPPPTSPPESPSRSALSCKLSFESSSLCIREKKGYSRERTFLREGPLLSRYPPCTVLMLLMYHSLWDRIGSTVLADAPLLCVHVQYGCLRAIGPEPSYFLRRCTREGRR